MVKIPMVKITLDTAPYVVDASDGVTVFREADEFAKQAANTDLITFDAVLLGRACACDVTKKWSLSQPR